MAIKRLLILTLTQHISSPLLVCLQKLQVPQNYVFARAFDRTDERASFCVSFVGKEEIFQNRFQNTSSNYRSQQELTRGRKYQTWFLALFKIRVNFKLQHLFKSIYSFCLLPAPSTPLPQRQKILLSADPFADREHITHLTALCESARDVLQRTESWGISL